MTRFQFVSVCAAVLLSNSVNAQSADCDNATDQSTLNLCAGRAYEVADAHLDETYKALAERLDPASLKRLRQAQEAWVSYRDAQCAFETEPSRNGSIYPLVLSNCLQAVTTAQIGLLEEHLFCEEGDVSCVRR